MKHEVFSIATTTHLWTWTRYFLVPIPKQSLSVNNNCNLLAPICFLKPEVFDTGWNIYLSREEGSPHSQEPEPGHVKKNIICISHQLKIFLQGRRLTALRRTCTSWTWACRGSRPRWSASRPPWSSACTGASGTSASWPASWCPPCRAPTYSCLQVAFDVIYYL